MPETHNRSRLLRLLLAVAVLALVAGGCGSDDDADDAGPETSDEANAGDDTTADAESESDDDGAGDPTDETEAGTDEAEAEDASGSDDDTQDEPVDTTTTEAATTTAPPESTTTLAAQVGLPPEDERGENEAGVRIDLDETATLACALAEFARDALRTDMLDIALQDAAAAADRAEPSAVTELAELAPELRAAQTAAEVEAVIDETLDICVERGHQI